MAYWISAFQDKRPEEFIWVRSFDLSIIKSSWNPALGYTCISRCLNFFTYLPKAKFSIYSNKLFHNFHLFESSFTCPGLQASGLAQKLMYGKCHGRERISCCTPTGIFWYMFGKSHGRERISCCTPTGIFWYMFGKFFPFQMYLHDFVSLTSGCKLHKLVCYR